LTPTNQQRRANADGLINLLFGQAKCWRSKKGKGKGKSTMPTFCSVDMMIGIG